MSKTENKKLVLVVDDHPKLLRFVEISLKLSGFDVVCSGSGREALEQIRSTKPDIMLLDIVMPDMDGFEVLRQLRAFSRMPVIALSASPANHQPALQLGANVFMPKPFAPDELVSRINDLLNRAKPE